MALLEQVSEVAVGVGSFLAIVLSVAVRKFLANRAWKMGTDPKKPSPKPNNSKTSSPTPDSANNVMIVNSTIIVNVIMAVKDKPK